MMLTLAEKQELNAFTRAYTFTAPTPLVFEPGQFLRLKKPGDDQKNARAFSCASAPGTTHVTFLVKHIPDGVVSGYLHSAPLGSPLESSAPMGKFTLNAQDAHRMFVATGTGLAPIISFLESAQGREKPYAILFGVHDRTHLFWTEKLAALPAASATASETIITLSRPDDAWHGARGRVTTHVPTVLAAHPHAAWYLCGNPEMVVEVRSQLLTAGVQPPDIHFEIF